MIIVIDGRSGSGKSSTAKAVAEELGIQYLDSGALYRAVTFIWLEENKPSQAFLEILSTKDIQFEYRDKQFFVYVDGVDVSLDLRKQRVSDHVSRVAAMPFVREFVNRLMRKAVKRGHFIADGRDLGSAVFPDADVKFYMDASLDVRAGRRHAEMAEDGEAVSLKVVKESLSQRDFKDQSREVDPLVKPEGAYVIDTSHKKFDEQVKEINDVIKQKTNLNINS